MINGCHLVKKARQKVIEKRTRRSSFNAHREAIRKGAKKTSRCPKPTLMISMERCNAAVNSAFLVIPQKSMEDAMRKNTMVSLIEV